MARGVTLERGQRWHWQRPSVHTELRLDHTWSAIQPIPDMDSVHGHWLSSRHTWDVLDKIINSDRYLRALDSSVLGGDQSQGRKDNRGSAHGGSGEQGADSRKEMDKRRTQIETSLAMARSTSCLAVPSNSILRAVRVPRHLSGIPLISGIT